MKRQKVISSNIASIGYDPKLRVLEIEFQTGGIYQYDNVPITRYQGLMVADSKGTYFATYIKNNANFPFRRINKR